MLKRWRRPQERKETEPNKRVAIDSTQVKTDVSVEDVLEEDCCYY